MPSCATNGLNRAISSGSKDGTAIALSKTMSADPSSPAFTSSSRGRPAAREWSPARCSECTRITGGRRNWRPERMIRIGRCRLTCCSVGRKTIARRVLDTPQRHCRRAIANRQAEVQTSRPPRACFIGSSCSKARAILNRSSSCFFRPFFLIHLTLQYHT